MAAMAWPRFIPAMLNALIALHALGYPNSHPAVAKAQRDFEGLFVNDPEDFRIQPCLSPVWDTAINIIALAESGLPAEHPSLQKAAAWLSNKEVRFRGDWAKNNPHPDASGWAFEYNNVYYPDTDDTAMVLMALRLVHPRDKNSYEDLFQRALAWQLSFQCRDGGWAAFDKDVIDGWLENMPFADHNAILDPTCSDLTARTLELFGYINFDRQMPVGRDRDSVFDRHPGRRWLVVRALGRELYLRHLAGPARTARHRSGHDARLDSARARLAGELSERRRRLGRNVRHIRTSFGQRQRRKHCFTDVLGNHGHLRVWRSRSAQRTTRVALSSFDPTGDGSWNEPQITGTGFPGVFYLKYDMYRQNFPLLALATYVNYRSGLGHPPSFFRCG